MVVVAVCSFCHSLGIFDKRNKRIFKSSMLCLEDIVLLVNLKTGILAKQYSS